MTRLSMLVFAVLAFVACKNPGAGSADTAKYPGTEAGAKQLLSEIRTSEDPGAMTRALKPTTADFKAVYTDDVAGQMERGFEKLWADPKAVIATKQDHTDVILSKISSDDLAKWTPQAVMEFPGGYKRVGPKLKPGLTVYRWKYVKPGEQIGTSFDGLIYVNSHWAWFPKPWRVLDSDGGGSDAAGSASAAAGSAAPAVGGW